MKQGALEGIPIGDTVGILGAPDTLPEANHLDGTGWAACATPDATSVRLGGDRLREAPDVGGIVVSNDGETYVIAGSTSYRIPEQERTAVLRAIGLDTAVPAEVRGEWLALFERGTDLRPLAFDGSGTVDGVDLPAGSVIRPTGGGDDERYLLTADGSLARLSGLAYRLYLLGGGSGSLGEEVEISPSQIGALPTADAAGAADWPQRTLAPVAATTPCATLSGSADDQRTVLADAGQDASTGADDDDAARPSDDASGSGAAAGSTVVTVAEDGGALVRGGSAGALTLIDGSGTAYAVPGEVTTGVARLGFAEADVAVVPAAWIQLLPAGPALTQEAASASPTAS